MVTILQAEAQFTSDSSSSNAPKIKLSNYYNLYPEIELYIDVPVSFEKTEDKTLKTYSTTYDCSNSATDIKLKTTLSSTCGTLTFKLIDDLSGSLINEGCRVRLYLDHRCYFCGWIFTLNISGKHDLSVTCYDWLRYFKVPLVYGKKNLLQDNGQGLVASDIFTKICKDLAIPYKVEVDSTVPVTAQNYDMKTAFNIMEFAITHTLMNQSGDTKNFYTIYHETNFLEDYNKNVNKNWNDTEVCKTSGSLVFNLRNDMTTDIVVDDNFLTNYKFKSSIDDNTYNEIIVYKDDKTYLGKDGKTSKTAKKTGTRTITTASSEQSKYMYGYLPYYHKAPDTYTQAQMEDVAGQLLEVLNRPTHNISFESYGIIGLRAGHLLPVMFTDLNGRVVADINEETQEVLPVYRTVKSCELTVDYPLKMRIEISDGKFTETS
jgi:hypothetical protein